MAKYVSKIKHARRTLPCGSRPVEAPFGASMGENGARCAISEQNEAYCPIYEGHVKGARYNLRLDRSKTSGPLARNK
jgi:hypothetical protein